MNRRVWNGKYIVHSKNDYSAMVEVFYTCPYCGEETGAYLTIYPESYDLIDNGGFFEPLKCTYCNEKADVMFGKQ
jgi:hypothetical protein